MKLKGILKDNKGVSEVVAVLVLVAVVIVGAIGVGTIMNGFSNQVSQSASTGDIQSGSKTELLYAGSTTVQDLVNCLAPAFMAANPGVKVTSQGGGSGVGLASAGMNIVDLAGSSDSLTSAATVNATLKWPNMKFTEVGVAAAAVIVSKGCTTIPAAVDKAALYTCYNSTTAAGCTGVLTGTAVPDAVYRREAGSGTMNSFRSWIGMSSESNLGAYLTTAQGNDALVADVGSAPAGKCYIGFADYGLASLHTDTVTILPLTDSANTYATSLTNTIITSVWNAKKDITGTAGYPYAMLRPVLFVTNGNPDVVAQKFIDFASQYGTANSCFNSVGYVPEWSIQSARGA